MQTASCNLRIYVIKQTLINNSIQSAFRYVTLPNPSIRIKQTLEIHTYRYITMDKISNESIEDLISVTLAIFVNAASGIELAWNNVRVQ